MMKIALGWIFKILVFCAVLPIVIFQSIGGLAYVVNIAYGGWLVVKTLWNAVF